MTPMEIMDAIRKALDADPRSQRVIAKAANIHPVNLSQFKAGNRVLSFETICTLADVLGLEVTVIPPKGRQKQNSRNS